MTGPADRHAGTFRGFVRSREAWYGASLGHRADEILIGQWHPAGGTTGEYAIVWHPIGRRRRLSPRLEAFDDSWSALLLHADLLAELGRLDGTDPTPDELQALLLRLGFRDCTQREHPQRAARAPSIEHLPPDDTEGGEP